LNAQARIDRAWAFKQSITLDKLQQLMRWGFVEAHNLIPDNEGNAETLRSFFQAFDRLPHCKFLAPLFDSLEFEVEDGAHVKWDLFLVKADGERVHYQELPKHLK
jgi:hypothetical protein